MSKKRFAEEEAYLKANGMSKEEIEVINDEIKFTMLEIEDMDEDDLDNVIEGFQDKRDNF